MSVSMYPLQAKYEFEEGVNPVVITVHPSGDELVCSTSTGDCKLVLSSFLMYMLVQISSRIYFLASNKY